MTKIEAATKKIDILIKKNVIDHEHMEILKEFVASARTNGSLEIEKAEIRIKTNISEINAYKAFLGDEKAGEEIMSSAIDLGNEVTDYFRREAENKKLFHELSDKLEEAENRAKEKEKELKELDEVL